MAESMYAYIDTNAALRSEFFDRFNLILYCIIFFYEVGNNLSPGNE